MIVQQATHVSTNAKTSKNVSLEPTIQQLERSTASLVQQVRFQATKLTVALTVLLALTVLHLRWLLSYAHMVRGAMRTLCTAHLAMTAMSVKWVRPQPHLQAKSVLQATFVTVTTWWLPLTHRSPAHLATCRRRLSLTTSRTMTCVSCVRLALTAMLGRSTELSSPVQRVTTVQQVHNTQLSIHVRLPRI